MKNDSELIELEYSSDMSFCSITVYTFERNNPYKYEDETGHVWQLVLAYLGIVGFIGSVENTFYTV